MTEPLEHDCSDEPKLTDEEWAAVEAFAAEESD